MNIFTLTNQVTARVFAWATLTAMILSAFPASFFVAEAASGNTDAVGTVAVFIAASPASGNSEYVQVKFTGTGTLNLEDWTIEDETGLRHTFSAGVTLTSGDTYNVCGDSSLPVVCDVEIDNGGNSVWNNSGDTMTLKDENGAVVHTVSWTSTTEGEIQGVGEGSAVDYAPKAIAKAASLEVVTGDTASGENMPGWLFNRDLANATPIEFNKDESVIGDGSLNVLPISNSDAPRKFIGEFFYLGEIADLTTFSYDFKIGAGGAGSDANEFYLNVYANFAESSATNYYDCKYDLIPTTGSTGSFTTVEFDPTASYPVTTRGSSPYTCPAVPADMDNEGAGATIRAFAINTGDTTLTDADLDGYFDNVVLETATEIKTFDFEPVPLPECEDTDSLADTTFDTFSLGNVDGQNDWSSTGPFDQEIVENTYGYVDFGCQSLRVSNAVTSGSFGDQTFAAPIPDSVGDSDATAGAFAEGTRYNHFDIQFDIASTKPDQKQDGLALSVSPDRGDGSRMSYLSFADVDGGIEVTFYDTQGETDPASFVPTVLGIFDRSEPHTIRFELDMIDGVNNDVVRIYIDGGLEHTGTSWENYYRNDAEANAEQSPRLMKTLLIRSAGGAVVENDGEGFLFDNMTLAASYLPEPEEEVVTIVAEKIVCLDESLLPNGGYESIDENTASEFLAQNPSCYMQEGFEFQWAAGGIKTDGAPDNGGELDNPWNTSDPTDSNGKVVITVGEEDLGKNSTISIREVNQEHYLEFSGKNGGDVTAEIYCHNDAGNYDNLEWVQGVEAGDDNTYHCVAWNVPEVATVVAEKIVCLDEADLPNWGKDGGPDITETTASDWVAEHKGCSLVPDWKFEWGTEGAHNPDQENDPHYGTAGGDWTTFGPTNSDGVATTGIPVATLENNSKIWVREVLQENFMGFTYTPDNKKNDNDVSAEMYCHKDVLNYDNYDFIQGAEVNETYHCVAWNVPEVQTCDLELVSDSGTVVVENNDYATSTYEHNAWTASIDDAEWIWESYYVNDPTVDQVLTFKETFEVTDVNSANLEIAADNGYRVYLNGVLVADRFAQGNNFQSHTQKDWTLDPNDFINGENTLEIEVKNNAAKNSNSLQNPAGVLYKLTVNADEGCEVTTETEEEVEECEAGVDDWADYVVASDQGTNKNGSAVSGGDRTDDTATLDEADWVGGNGFFSLGFGGSIDLGFDYYVLDVAGDDLFIHEATNGTYPEEKAEVWVSQNGTDWFMAGYADNNGSGVTGVDFSGTGLEWVKYVRLVDVSDSSLHNAVADGFDLDAVKAAETVCDEPKDDGEGENEYDRYTLTIEITGDGFGEVFGTSTALDTPAIECDGDNLEESVCSVTYPEGTVVDLEAIADLGSNFDNSWTIGFDTCTGNNTPCSVTMTQDVDLVAHFDLEDDGGSTSVTRSGSRSSSRSTSPDGQVAGAGTSTPQVLGDQVSIVPAGGANAGAGSTSAATISLAYFGASRRRDLTNVK